MSQEVFVPDGVPEEAALARTTHLGVVAHPDDLEILAQPGILDCFGRDDRWFCGVVVTDGAGSPRSGPYANVGDREMVEIRRREQRKAAVVGEFGAAVMLGVSSAEVKDAVRAAGWCASWPSLLRRTRPEVALHAQPRRPARHARGGGAARGRGLPRACRRPSGRGGCWAARSGATSTGSRASDRLAVDVTPRENIVAALIGVFDSQITGGKRYDLAVLGPPPRPRHLRRVAPDRRRHRHQPLHGHDPAAGRMRPRDPAAFVRERDRALRRRRSTERLARLGGPGQRS